jgi:enamine deaminase RidA (YjgF/YER057c/UK114 family)
MSRQHIQPPELFQSAQFGFTQVVATSPGRLIFISGQVAWDRDMQLVGGPDLGAQTEQALINLRYALGAAGARPADITQLRIYVVDHKPEYIDQVVPRLGRFFDGAPRPAQTWIGVQSLALPDFLIEIEAIAVLTS